MTKRVVRLAYMKSHVHPWRSLYIDKNSYSISIKHSSLDMRRRRRRISQRRKCEGEEVKRSRSVSRPYPSLLGRLKLGFLCLDLMWFNIWTIREGKESEGLLGNLIIPNTKDKAIDVKRKAIRGRLKSPREVATITQEKNFRSTGR